MNFVGVTACGTREGCRGRGACLELSNVRWHRLNGDAGARKHGPYGEQYGHF